jgi:hypothetical protein
MTMAVFLLATPGACRGSPADIVEKARHENIADLGFESGFSER